MKAGRSKDYLKGTRRHGGSQGIPIERFLRSKKGKNWDKVYSEASKEFKHGTEAANQFFDLLDSHVAKNCWKGADTGTFYDSKGEEVNGWFVNPMTGCLDYHERPPRKRDPKPLTSITIDSKTHYSKEDGIWYMIRYSDKKDAYDPDRYLLAEMRQLTSHELKAAGIHNDSWEDQQKAKEERKKKERELYLSGLYWP